MTAFALAGLAAQMLNALASVPFRRPWVGPEGLLHNTGLAVTRTVMRGFLGYATSLPIAEFRSLEWLLDGLCRVVLPPFLGPLDVTVEATTLAGIDALRFEPRSSAPRGTILYLHGGGHIGTSPAMYTIFMGTIVHETGCRLFVPDYRLAPEFPFPCSLADALATYRRLLDDVPPGRLFVAGDSAGGGLVSVLLLAAPAESLPTLAGAILFSPEASLALDDPSVTGNAGRDILPWNVPVWPYLRGLDARDPSVCAIDGDCRGFPPTFVSLGGDEIFRDAIRRFVERLRASGVETTAVEEPGMFHAFPLLVPWADASQRVCRTLGAFAQRRLVAAGPRPRASTAATRGLG
jgi:acetyl esterase/lipase